METSQFYVKREAGTDRRISFQLFPLAGLRENDMVTEVPGRRRNLGDVVTFVLAGLLDD